MLSSENRLSDVPSTELHAAVEAELVPNPGVVFPKRPPLPAAADSLNPNPLPKALPPDPTLFVEKLNPDAEPNAEVDGAFEVGALKEKELAEAAEGAPEEEPKPEPNPEEEPNPDEGCVGTAGDCPNPDEEPNPLFPGAKLKVLAWTGAVLPNPKVWNKMCKYVQHITQQLPTSHSLSILYEDNILSLPLLSKEDVEDPNPTAGVDPKPPVDT